MAQAMAKKRAPRATMQDIMKTTKADLRHTRENGDDLDGRQDGPGLMWSAAPKGFIAGASFQRFELIELAVKGQHGFGEGLIGAR